MTVEVKTTPNLVQGVSQQAAQQRRDSQCEAQFDCVNSPKDGCVARAGAEMVKLYPGADYTGAFMYELFRGLDEHYLVTIKGGGVRIFDLKNNALCTVAGSEDFITYLNAGRDQLVAQPVDDFLFVANKTVAPAMLGTVTPSRPKEALLFFKAGAYSSRFTVAVSYAGTLYRWSYKTPDNSVAGNAEYIATGQLAATFYRALTGVAAAGNDYGVGASNPGDTGGSGSGGLSVLDVSGFSEDEEEPQNLVDLGFQVELNGNLLRISRIDGVDFQVDVSDGAGDTYLVAIKDNIRAFSELPKGGFEGFTVRVRGKSAEDNSSDYWVQFTAKTAASGFWREVPEPGTKTTIDPDTMPHAIVNTGPGTFEVRKLTWSTRIAGDGENTAKDPGFIGRPIQDIYFHKGRLAFLTEASADWSKARNVYTHFPDTVQTVLSDAPIGVILGGADTIALLRKAVQIDESLFLWAQGAQFRVHSNSDPFRSDTVEADPATSYEFTPTANFAKVGSSTLYFASEPDDKATIRSLQFQQGRVVGDVDVTDHVPDYIPAGVRRISYTDTGRMLLVQTDGAANRLYLYNYLVQDRAIVQSAWNTWRLPEGTILWSTIYRMNVLVAFQRLDGLMFLRIPLSPSVVDPDGGDYNTRLDLRVTEGAVVSEEFNALTDETTITVSHAFAPADIPNLRVIQRAPSSVAGVNYQRGKQWVIREAVGSEIRVAGDIRGIPYFVGLRVESIRDESTFYLRSDRGIIATDSLKVREFAVTHDRTAAYRIEAHTGAGRVKVEELTPIPVGELLGGNRLGPRLTKGKLKIAVDQDAEETLIRLINDTPFPSRWQSAEYHYEAVMRSKPSRVRSTE